MSCAVVGAARSPLPDGTQTAADALWHAATCRAATDQRE